MWGWPIAAYLFFGGLSAGTFVVSALVQLAHGNRFIRTVRVGSALALLFLGVGVAFLLAEVGVPLRALDVFPSFQSVGTSWMARGAWILMGCAIVFALYALVAVAPWEKMRGGVLARRRAVLLNVLGIAGMAAAGCLALYTGLLLMDASGVPAWQTWLVPALFLLSALDTGLALMAALFRRLQVFGPYWLAAVRRFDGALAFFLVVELVVLGVYLALMLEGGGTSQAFLQALANESVFFLLVSTLLMLAAALASSIAQRCGAGRGSLTPLIAAACSLIGGFLLRASVLALGVHGSLVPALIFWA